MVRKHLPDDLERPLMAPMVIPHPVFDAFFPDRKDTRTSGLRLGRCMLNDLKNVLTTSEHLFEQFRCNFDHVVKYGFEENSIIAKPIRQASPQGAAKLLNKLRKTQTDDGAKVIRRIQDEHRQAVKQAVDFCWNCKKAEIELESGQQLRACVKCKAIGRKIVYCSRLD